MDLNNKLKYFLLSFLFSLHLSCNEKTPLVTENFKNENSKINTTGHILFYGKKINIEKINKKYLEKEFGIFKLSIESSNDSILYYYNYIDNNSEFISNHTLNKYGIREIPVIWLKINPYLDSSIAGLSTQFFTDFNEDKFIPGFCSFPNNEIPIKLVITKKRDLDFSGKKYSIYIEYLF